MELYGDQVEVVKDSFAITASTSVMPLQKKTMEDNLVRISKKLITTKEINIDEKPKLIIVGFSPKTTTKSDVFGSL